MSPSQEEFRFLEESFDADARHVLAQLRKGRKFPSVNQLDERPKAVTQDSPAYPRALKDDGVTGQAEIEFVIDKDGRVLFPRIVSASHEDFGWAAATAVAQWKFQPPQLNGQKVEAVMRVPILFDAHKLASAD
jgi:TonB family protein